MLRWSLALTLTASVGCSFALAPPGSGDDGIPEGRRTTLTDDTAADFTDNGGLVEGVVAARGALEPHAYVVGGLKGRGFNNNVVNATRSYDDVVAAVGPELGAAYRQVPRDLNGTNPNRPRGMGLTSNTFTVLYSGEILLPQGPLSIVTDADDDMLLQIELAPGTWTPKLYTARAEASMTIDVPAAGWYPLRAAYGQNGGGALWRLRYIPLGAPSVDIDGSRLRARVTADAGLIASVFEGKVLMTPRGEGAVTTIDENYLGGPPGHDLPIVITDQYSLRFAGQLRVDAPGSYTFTVEIGSEAFDIFRLWIDGVQVANAWPPTSDKRTATLDLSAGWHDLLLDYGEENTLAQVQLRMAGPGIPDGVIDPQRLRPAVSSAQTAPYVAFTTVPLNDATSNGPGVTIVPMPLTAPTGATIVSADYGLGISNQRLSDLTIDLLDCHGAKTMPPITTQLIYYYYPMDTSCVGEKVVPATPWAWRLTDTVVGNDPAGQGSVYNPILVATYTGGDRTPFAPSYEFISSPKPTPGSIGFGAIDVTADLRGTTLMIEVRSGADPTALAAASWVPVANGEVPAVDAGEWAQYRLAVSGDGWKLASIDKVDLTYVVPDE